MGLPELWVPEQTANVKGQEECQTFGNYSSVALHGLPVSGARQVLPSLSADGLLEDGALVHLIPSFN